MNAITLLMKSASILGRLYLKLKQELLLTQIIVMHYAMYFLT